MSKLYFRHSTMGAGKSLQLIAAAHNYLERGMRPLVLNYMFDTRYGAGVVASRTGLKLEAVLFDETTEIINQFDILDPVEGMPDAIFVDEAQFLTEEQVEDLHYVATHWGIPVLCYGLRVDFLGRLFTGSAALFAHAETSEEIKTICKCGKKATHVGRYQDGVICTTGETIQIGDAEYRSMCYACFSREMQEAHQRTNKEV